MDILYSIPFLVDEYPNNALVYSTLECEHGIHLGQELDISYSLS